MLEAIYIMGGLGIIIGIVLAAASKIFYVYVDPMVMAVEGALPGANCGGCGLPGCSANAEAIVAGKAAPNSCVAGGSDLAGVIAGILGVSVEAKEPDIALPGCTYGVRKADLKYSYDGINDCRAAALLSGGMKVCNIGCLGLGTCAKSCPFNAITMGPEGLPVVNEERCTGCGTCERACPKHIITLSSVTRRIIREYTTDDCTTPCQRACPAGIDIREYIHQVSLGDYHRAIQVIKERNPFPTVIGRICPRPCENECRRKHIDEPVAINGLKRFAADFEKSRNERILPFKAPATGRRIAVIGGGVEGLSTAFFSARLGHELTVYEASDKPGGLLKTAIARNRLPMTILDWDIDGIREIGVNLRTSQMLGRDTTIAALLKEGYEAVFLASGGWDSRLARGAANQIESPIPGVFLLIDLLRPSIADNGAIPCAGKQIVIAGGGKAAVKAAMICKERGAAKVTVLLRETKEAAKLDEPDMAQLKAAGATVRFQNAIDRINGEADAIVSLEIIDLSSGEKQIIASDSLFIAAGRFPELIFARPRKEEKPETGEVNTWEAVPPSKHPEAYDERSLLTNADPLTDISAAIRAIAAGRRGAASIHQVIYGLEMGGQENVLKPDTYVQDVDHLEAVAPTKRHIMPVCNPEDMKVECELGFDEETAKTEAGRCLKCGLVCYQKEAQSMILPGIRPADLTAMSSVGSRSDREVLFDFEDRGRIH